MEYKETFLVQTSVSGKMTLRKVKVEVDSFRTSKKLQVGFTLQDLLRYDWGYLVKEGHSKGVWFLGDNPLNSTGRLIVRLT